jgi:hypothetical protein
MPLMPNRDPLRPSLQKQIDDLRAEVEALKQKPEKDYLPKQHSREIVFSYPGEVVVGAKSGGYLFKDFDAIIHRVDITADVTGSGSSVFNVLVNGSQVYEDTLPAGDSNLTIEDLAIEVEERDVLAVRWASAGTGLASTVLTFTCAVVDEEEFV